MKRNLSIIILLFLTGTLSAQTLYPGDATDNGTANSIDILRISQGYGMRGPARNTVTTNWAAQSISQLWQGMTIPGVPNPAYADCNGDGSIDSLDFEVVEQNYGLTRTGLIPDSGVVFSNQAPPLAFMINQDSVGSSDTLMLNIELGTPLFPTTNIHGIAFTITYDTSVTDTFFATIGASWLGIPGNSYHLVHSPERGKIDIVITRTVNVTATGSGTIGVIGIVMEDNLKNGYYINLGFERIVAIGSNGVEVPIRPVVDSVLLSNKKGAAPIQPYVELYPNPAKDQFNVRSRKTRVEKLTLFDHQGRAIRSWEANESGYSVMGIPNGLYYLRIQTKAGMITRKLLLNPGRS